MFHEAFAGNDERRNDAELVVILNSDFIVGNDSDPDREVIEEHALIRTFIFIEAFMVSPPAC